MNQKGGIVTTDRRPQPPSAAPPMEMLAAFLDFHRATLLWKIAGVSDEDLRRPMVPSGTCLLGIVKHSTFVERWWFRAVFAGEKIAVPWLTNDRDADWRIEAGESTEELVTLYRREIDRSRAIVSAASWDDRAKRVGFDQTLGWIMAHMVEEVARHNGHADILRELIDGATGK